MRFIRFTLRHLVFATLLLVGLSQIALAQRLETPGFDRNQFQRQVGPYRLSPPQPPFPDLDLVPSSSSMRSDQESEDCRKQLNQPIDGSRYRVTCIETCGEEKLVYIERRIDLGPASSQHGKGRLMRVPVDQQITKDYAKSLFPDGFFRSKSYDQVGAQLECSVSGARAINLYADRLHGSLRRGLTCRHGKIESVPRGSSLLLSLNVRDKERVKFEKVCHGRERNFGFQAKVRTERVGRGRDRQVKEYETTWFPLGPGSMTCKSKDNLAVQVTNDILIPDAQSCNIASTELNQRIRNPAIDPNTGAIVERSVPENP